MSKNASTAERTIYHPAPAPITTPGSRPSRSSTDDCPTCRGAGFLVEDVDYRHPNFGKPFPCPTCHDGELARRLSEMSQLTGMLRQKRIKDFTVREGTREAFLAVRDYAHEPRGFLTLWGGFGCGKTHLLAALVNELTAASIGAVYYTLPDMLDVLRDAVGGGDMTAQQARMLNVRVLCIDEVDKVRLTDWARERIYQIVDARYRLRGQQGTVFALNVEPRRGDGDLGYFYSRMHDGRVIHVTAGDMRRGD